MLTVASAPLQDLSLHAATISSPPKHDEIKSRSEVPTLPLSTIVGGDNFFFFFLLLLLLLEQITFTTSSPPSPPPYYRTNFSVSHSVIGSGRSHVFSEPIRLLNCTDLVHADDISQDLFLILLCIELRQQKHCPHLLLISTMLVCKPASNKQRLCNSSV
ncbi:Hypothetical predicted protein [Podarcis lilfordi]|uniref:Uncharacterized protein n=1 Tax=Podarcis lilfordi TaxID=74358 RepID=A0AA35JYL3_9SAUR|nr:Hypothetical predicted protein [Podarcis lilfordi]